MNQDDGDPSAADTPVRRHVVLCVDDDASVLAALRKLFRTDYEVVTVKSAAHALSALRHHPVEVIISEEQIPGMSGSELLGEIAQRWPKIRRVILTALSEGLGPSRELGLGAELVFPKPWNDEALRLAVRRLIRSAGLSGEPVASDVGNQDEVDLGGESG